MCNRRGEWFALVCVCFFFCYNFYFTWCYYAGAASRPLQERIIIRYLFKSFVHSLGFDTDWFVFSEAVSFNSSLCVLGTVVSQRRRAYRLVPPSIKVIPINIRSLFISSIFHYFVDFNLIFCVCILSFFFASYMDFGVSVASLCSFSTLEIISTRNKNRHTSNYSCPSENRLFGSLIECNCFS